MKQCDKTKNNTKTCILPFDVIIWSFVSDFSQTFCIKPNCVCRVSLFIINNELQATVVDFYSFVNVNSLACENVIMYAVS